MSIQRLGIGLSLLSVLVASLVGSGCVTNGRRILLKEYGPSIPVSEGRPLEGAIVCILRFDSAPSLVSLEMTTKAEEPNSFQYLEFTREQERLWSKEMKALQKASAKATLKEIGNMRNGFGMVMSHVYALNDPGTWLVESLKYDLESQGARVVDASRAGDADVTLAGTIQRCSADMYMVINGTLVVDLEVRPKNGEALRHRIHTHGATTAVLASEGEYFHALRDARQKFSIFAIQAMQQVVKPRT